MQWNVNALHMYSNLAGQREPQPPERFFASLRMTHRVLAGRFGSYFEFRGGAMLDGFQECGLSARSLILSGTATPRCVVFAKVMPGTICVFEGGAAYKGAQRRVAVPLIKVHGFRKWKSAIRRFERNDNLTSC